MSELKKPAAKNKRYFEAETPEGDEQPVLVNFHKKKESKFSGDVIKVDEHRARPLRHKKFNKRIKLEAPQINPVALERHSRGSAANVDGVKTDYFKQKLKRKEVYLEFSNEQAARTEILRNEEEGFIEPEDGESTADYTQGQIVANVDITSATKHFNLDLDFGPYRMKYTKNGRHLLLGGKMGHVAAFDWVTKRLLCEMNVTEEVTDVAWLHIETMFAVAQKNWVHFYDNQGTELHCVKKMNRITHLEFLPYHFLLTSANTEGYISWLDVSIGEMVTQYNTRLGPIRMMCHNPSNGVICIGGSKGVVSMWSPSQRDPLAKMLCHPTAMSSLTVDPQGTFMATSGLDKSIKIWDIRALNGPVVEYRTRMPAQEMSISQKGLLSLAMGNVCEIYKKPNVISSKTPYLRQRCVDYISGMEFCSYEDVLGISTRKGFSSLLVPGSGEPNFDARESNPYRTKSQRREFEVHALLDKIPSEFIALDPNAIAAVDVPSFKEKVDAKKKLLHLKTPTINFEPRNKMKGKGGSANAARAKKIVKDSSKRAFGGEMLNIKQQIFEEHRQETKQSADFIPLEQREEPKSVLDRFKPQKRKGRK